MARTFVEARAARRGSTGLVPTLGYLHEGHLSLIAGAGAAADTVVVSLYVNPLQFGPDDDLSRYPRDLERDAALAQEAGADVLFAPGHQEMYPDHPYTRVAVEALTQTLEGRFRPGHFEGVATVVAKLFAGLQPDRAFFGRKDAQQVAVVRRMAADLSFPVEVVAMPTVREADGLALSSRNTYLDPEERRAAAALSQGLFDAADAVEAGERDAAVLEELVRRRVGAEPSLALQYVELADAVETTRLLRLDREAFLAAAMHAGGTRLIDNVWLTPDGTGGFAADRGVRLDHPTVLRGQR